MTDFIGEFMSINFDTVNRLNQDTTNPEVATFQGIYIPSEWSDERTYITPLTVDIPISFYVVREGKDTLQVSEDNGANFTTITLDHGNYSIDNIATQLQTKLNASLSFTYTVKTATTDNPNAPETGKLYFSVSGNSGIQPQIRFYLSNDDGTDTLFETIGFNFYGDTYNDGAIFNFSSNTLVSPNVCQLNPENYIKIYCTGIAGFDNNNLKHAEPFLVISCRQAVPFSNIVFTNSDLLSFARKFNKRASTITFTLTDEYDIPIPMNGINWSMTCVFFERLDLTEKIENYIKYIINRNIQTDLEKELKKK